MSDRLFNAEHFLLLRGDEVIAYAEPFVTTQVDCVPRSAYQKLLAVIDDLSDIHTVYALEVCMHIDPEDFIKNVVRFLSSADSAVCCTACRLIESLSPEAVSAELRERIASIPVVELFSSDVRSGDRIHVGSNEKLLLALNQRFS